AHRALHSFPTRRSSDLSAEAQGPGCRRSAAVGYTSCLMDANPDANARDHFEVNMSTATRKRRVIPGFGLTMGFSLLYLGFIFLIPVGGLLLYTSMMSWEDFWRAVSHPQVVASYKLSFSA